MRCGRCGRWVGLRVPWQPNSGSRSGGQAESFGLAWPRWRALGMDQCQQQAGRERMPLSPFAFTLPLAGFRKEMLKQDVFKDAFGWISISLHKLFKYSFALTTESGWLISGLDFQPYFCLALVSNHQASVAFFWQSSCQRSFLSRDFLNQISSLLLGDECNWLSFLPWDRSPKLPSAHMSVSEPSFYSGAHSGDLRVALHQPFAQGQRQ